MVKISRNSWHFRLLSWCWGEKDIERMNSLCPYFWGLVSTIIFFPFVLLVRALSNVSIDDGTLNKICIPIFSGLGGALIVSAIAWNFWKVLLIILGCIGLSILILGTA